MTSIVSVSGAAVSDVTERLAAVASNDIAGSTGLTFTATGTLSGIGALAGSTGLTFAATGTLGGVGAVIGSTNLSFTATGSLSGVGQLQGSTSLNFSPSGTLSGVGQLSGSASLTFGATGTLTDAGGGQPAPRGGDDGGAIRRKLIIYVRPKIERDLDDVLEIIEAIPDSAKPKERRAAIKSARAVLKATAPPIQYKARVKAIDTALAALQREAADHQGAQAAIMRAALQIETLIAELERMRMLRKKRNEEALLWLST